MNPRRRRHRRAVRARRHEAERRLSEDACLYGQMHTRAVAPYTGTFAAWRRLPVFPDRMGVLYHPALIQQISRRSVLLDLLRPMAAHGGRP